LRRNLVISLDPAAELLKPILLSTSPEVAAKRLKATLAGNSRMPVVTIDEDNDSGAGKDNIRPSRKGLVILSKPQALPMQGTSQGCFSAVICGPYGRHVPPELVLRLGPVGTL
jgi:hypothetical protein